MLWVGDAVRHPRFFYGCIAAGLAVSCHLKSGKESLQCLLLSAALPIFALQNRNKMARHNSLGKEGELFAQNYLRSQGYVIRDVNWRTGRMEIDIVAETADFLVIVEVKTRTDDYWMNPADAVTPARMKRMTEAAHEYVLQHNLDKEVRFDVITLLGKAPDFRLEHIADAFLAPLC